ncbi:MAG: TlpA disulfide reductase family protein [Acidimicrobiia bacterium]|nr:TlpA disulfide reductase family protein [Acidimicrobiia bacterium]
MTNRTNTRPSLWSSPLLWILLLVGGAAIAAALLAARDDASITPALETSTVEVSGNALPPFAVPDPAVGLVAPGIVATTLDGERVSVASDGSARVMGFFAHWCPHCQAELPQVVDWLAASDLPGSVEVMAVSTSVRSDGDNYPPSAWFTRTGWPNMVLLDSASGEIAAMHGLTVFPYWVAVDGHGEVVARATGQIDEAQFRHLIAAANG